MLDMISFSTPSKHLFYHTSTTTSEYIFYANVISINVRVDVAIFVVFFGLEGRSYKTFKLAINILEHITEKIHSNYTILYNTLWIMVLLASQFFCSKLDILVSLPILFFTTVLHFELYIMQIEHPCKFFSLSFLTLFVFAALFSFLLLIFCISLFLFFYFEYIHRLLEFLR